MIFEHFKKQSYLFLQINSSYTYYNLTVKNIQITIYSIYKSEIFLRGKISRNLIYFNFFCNPSLSFYLVKCRLVKLSRSSLSECPEVGKWRAISIFPCYARKACVYVRTVWTLLQFQFTKSAQATNMFSFRPFAFFLSFLLHLFLCGLKFSLKELHFHKVLEWHSGVC